MDIHPTEITPGNAVELFFHADILIEAFDRAENKQWLITAWASRFPARPMICGNGIAGIGKTNELHVSRAGNIFFCGDMESEMSQGLCSARVGAVANMQANVAIELIVLGDIQMITVNRRDTVDWFAEMTVRILLERMGYDFALLTVTVNGSFVPTEDYDTPKRSFRTALLDVRIIHLHHGG